MGVTGNDDANLRGPFADADHDIVTGGSAVRSRKAALVMTLVAALLVAEPLWHRAAHLAAPARRADAAALSDRMRTPVTVPRPATAPTRPPVPASSSFLRPPARGGDLDLLRWFTSLPVAAARDAGAPVSSTVLLVRRRADLAGAASLVAAAHGAIGGGQLDATGTRVAFIVAPGGLSDRGVRTWAYVVAVRDAIVLTTLAVPRQAMVLGWFGDEVVIDRSAMGLSPLLLNGAARAAPRELEHGISAVADGVGDVQFIGPDLVHCLTGWRLGIAPQTGADTCPDDALMALSPQGRWAVTRDLRWLDRSTGHSTPLSGRPAAWPVESVDFVDGQRALVVLRAFGRRLNVLCAQRTGCARLG